jgi:hypothetical protein
MTADRLSDVAVEPVEATPSTPGASPSDDADADVALPRDRDGQHVVILSGLSGGGKTAAAKLF